MRVSRKQSSSAQNNKESLLDCANGFKQAKDIFKSTMGKGTVDKFIENTSSHAGATDDDERKELKKEGHDRFVAFTFVDNSDHKKCGVMLKNYKNNMRLGIIST